MQSYLEHQGAKLIQRFDAGSYVALTETLSNHDVGRGRGGVGAALRSCPVPTVVGGITSDRLYPLRLQQELADLLPGCTGLDVVESIYGHDGFLIETDAVGKLVRETLDLADRDGARRGDRPRREPFPVFRLGGRRLRAGPAVVSAGGDRLAAAADARHVLDLGAGTGKLPPGWSSAA